MTSPAIEALAPAAWAPRVADLLAERLRSNPALRLCLPTGDTPVPVYDELVLLARAGQCSFAEATVVLLDEWVGLPPGDPARCDVLIRAFLERLPRSPAAVHTWDVDGPDLAEAVFRHDEAAADLDLVVLGLGVNGHVGFNEPGSLPDDPTRIARLAAGTRAAAGERYGAGAVPAGGVTVGMNRILGAREAWLLVTGERKADVLRRALREPEGPDCPASYLRRHPNVRVFADLPAASRLPPAG